MNKSTLQSELNKHHKDFITLIKGLSDDVFVATKAEKWSPAQQLDHLCKSVNPLLLAYTLPRFILAIIFGKSIRESKTYEALVQKYQDKLQKGAVATGRFIPPTITINQKDALIQKLQKDLAKLNQKIENWQEEDLDKYVLPHPLLGKVTAREMLYFTIYHVQHHTNLIKRDYLS